MNERKQQLTDEMERLQIQEDAGVSLERRGEIEQRRREINDELAAIEQAEQQQEREVHTQEVNETNSDIAISVFDALVPEPKVFESVLGLTEFSDWRTGFYQLFDGMLAERTQLMNDKHAYELAQRDEKIRLLSKQGQDIQARFDEANKQLINERENYEGYKEDHEDFVNELKGKLDKAIQDLNQVQGHSDSLEKIIENGKAANASLTRENGDLRDYIATLNAKLEAAQTPKEESKPSQSFTDRMNEIKTKNSMSADEMILRFNARQKSNEAKIQVPDLPSAVLPFQGEDGSNPAADAGNNDVLVSEGAPVEPQFPSAPNVATVHAPDIATGNVSGESTHEQVAQKTETERIAELERRVEALEGKVA